jgi:hypothetical protein
MVREKAVAAVSAVSAVLLQIQPLTHQKTGHPIIQEAARAVKTIK